jgi:hypothetical protein
MRMTHWQAEAAPIIRTLLDAQDRVLAATNRVSLTECCDQLDAAVWDSDRWLKDHPCPDRRFGRSIDRLIRACVGIQAILLSNLLADEAYKAKTQGMLRDRLTAARKARIELRGMVGLTSNPSQRFRPQWKPVGAENLIRHRDLGQFPIDCAHNDVGNPEQ